MRETKDGDFTAPSYLDHVKVAKDIVDKRLRSELQGVDGIKTARGDYAPLELWGGRSKSQGTKPIKLSQKVGGEALKIAPSHWILGHSLSLSLPPPPRTPTGRGARPTTSCTCSS